MIFSERKRRKEMNAGNQTNNVKLHAVFLPESKRGAIGCPGGLGKHFFVILTPPIAWKGEIMTANVPYTSYLRQNEHSFIKKCNFCNNLKRSGTHL
jgi:hypothetical protein